MLKIELWTFLPIAKAVERMRVDLETNIERPSKPASKAVTSESADGISSAMPENFDVAISFAGTEREYALQLAGQVRAAGFAVFYDDFYPEQLWGKNLTVFFDEILAVLYLTAQQSGLSQMRQAGDEIEITPEMIEAGADALSRHDSTSSLAEPVVLDVYLAMAALDCRRVPRSP